MDIVAIGFPSPLSVWGFKLLEDLLAELYGEIAVRQLGKNDLPDDLGQARSVRLFTSSFPHPDLTSSCLENDLPVVVFADSPARAIRYQKLLSSQNTQMALRTISLAMVLCLPFMNDRNYLLIDRQKPRSYWSTLERVLNLIAPEGHTEKINDLVGRSRADGHSLDEVIGHTLGEQGVVEANDIDDKLCEQVVGGLFNYGMGGKAQPIIVWPHQCFLNGDLPDTYAPEVIEICGGARTIFYGPYYHLPTGRWQVSAILRFSAEMRGMTFTLKVVNSDYHDQVRICVPKEGTFAADFEIQVREPAEAIELLVMSDQGAIEGKIGLQMVTFENWQPASCNSESNT